MRAPDLSWVSHVRLDQLSKKEWKKFLPLCPDFVLELRSPSDSIRALKQKMEEYIANGARAAWLLDPVRKQVLVYGADRSVKVLDQPKRVSGEPTLQGFALDVERVWAAMERLRR